MMGYGNYAFMHGVFSIISTIIIIAFIIFMLRTLRGGRHGWRHHHWQENTSALEILKERYAKGEIERAEFEEKKKDLSA